MIIDLTPAEIQRSYEVAGQWAHCTLTLGVKGKYGAPEGGEGEIITLQGLRAEIAVAKALNLYWSGNVGVYGAVDVGGCVDVRSISKPHHSLILHKENAVNIPYVLAHVEGIQRVHLLGWCFGLEGMKRQYWADPVGGRPAYFVPQSALKPIPLLFEFLGKKAPASAKPKVSSDEFI